MAINTNSQTAASVHELCVCVCVLACTSDCVLAFLLVSEQHVWHPGQTPAAAAVIHFPVPLRVSALIALGVRWRWEHTHVTDLHISLWGDYMDSYRAIFLCEYFYRHINKYISRAAVEK